MLEKNQKMKMIAILISLTLIFAIFLIINPKATGFLSLIQNEKKSNELFENDALKNDSNKYFSKTTTAISSQISFEIVQPTTLEAKLIDGNVFPCPQFSNIVFEIENVGKFKAERLFFNHSENLRIENCLNCEKKQLLPKEKIKTTIKACISLDKNALIEFYSINAEKKQFRIE